jgi:hypothetical protein
MNKHQPHVYVIPEDDRDRQIADGFLLHDQVDTRRIQVMPPAGGWSYVLKTFQDEYVGHLRANPQGHVVLLIDFDGQYSDRRAEFEQAIPADLKPRVFVVGPRQTPELLRRELGVSFEQIGLSLADDCHADTEIVWGHDQLKHNDADRQRLVQVVKPILFGV